MDKPKRELKNFVINRPLQLRMVYYFTSLSVALVGLQLFMMSFFVNKLRVIIANVPSIPIAAQTQFEDTLAHLMSATLGFLLLSIMGAIVYGIVVSHRIAGPMFAILKCIDQMKTGNFKLVRKLRPSDELVPIMDSIHELATTLEKRH